ncbi:hypothetical protein CYY_002069 [Polysphondylium violaceum]|uniref:Tetratricopeptide-like helical domain-containing protein n=1 Tax=Polysphondylium violaceum TaxID=133409 RepID=A0A8J4Q022_9MYCE|nr:hypothetical protein CYY_002069 [Polysphondylium violaceum]
MINSLQKIILKPKHSKLFGQTIGTKNVLSLNINNNKKLNNNISHKSHNIYLFNSTTSTVVLNKNNKYYTSTTSINQVENAEKQYQTLLDNAIEQFKLKQLQSSIEILDKAIELCNNKPEAILLKADILNQYKFSLKVPDQLPIDLYNKAFELVPHKTKVDIYRSIIYYLPRTNLIELKSDYLDKYYQLDPNDEDVLYEVVLLGTIDNQVDQRLMDICKRLIDINSKYGTIALAFLSLAQQNFDQSKKLLQQVINHELNNPLERKQEGPIYHNRIVIAEKNGFTRIEDLLDQYSPILLDAYASLGYVERYNENFQESTEAIKKAAEINPNQYYLLGFLSENMRLMGDNEQSIMYATKCIEFDPDLETNEAYEACLGRGCTKIQAKDFDGAILDLCRLRQKDLELSVDRIQFRSVILQMLVYTLSGFIRYNTDIDLKRFNTKEIIKQEDYEDLCNTTTPKNVQTLLFHSQIYYRAFNTICQSIRGGMINASSKESHFMIDLEHFFYYISLYLLDSMYLNYIENHSDIVRPTDEYAFRNLIIELPYKESKQSQERQAIHKELFDIFNDLIKIIKDE